MTGTSKQKGWVFLALVALFVVPMFLAWLSYSKGLFLKQHTVNNGTLIQPIIPITTLNLVDAVSHQPVANMKGRWWLLYLSDSPQEPLAMRNLYFMHQIRQATGKDRARIDRALLTLSADSKISDWLRQNYPGTHEFFIPPNSLSLLESRLPKTLALRKGSLYLVDPLGNIIMFYAPDAAPKGILKDLKRVLKVSQIG